MKKRELEKFGKTMIDGKPGFKVLGGLVYAVPVNHVLRGVCLDGYHFVKEDYSADAFFLLPCFPAHYIRLSNGETLRPNPTQNHWSSLEPDHLQKLQTAFEKTAIPFLETVGDVQKVAKWLRRNGDLSNCTDFEECCYALLLAGNIGEALDMMRKMERFVVPTRAFENESMKRVRDLADLVERDADKAISQLLEWEAATLRSLRIAE